MEVDDELCCPSCSWIYYSTSISSYPATDLQYFWEVFNNSTGESLACSCDSTSDQFIYSWPYKAEYRIKLTVITPGANICSTEKVFYDEDCFAPCPPTGGGGGAPPYKQDPDPSPPCDIRIKRVYFEEINEISLDQFITIKDIKIQ